MNDQITNAGTNENDMESVELLTTAEVAAWLRVSQPTLRRWRAAGEGPTVTWLTSSLPRYLRSDVAAWLGHQRSVA